LGKVPSLSARVYVGGLRLGAEFEECKGSNQASPATTKRREKRHFASRDDASRRPFADCLLIRAPGQDWSSYEVMVGEFVRDRLAEALPAALAGDRDGTLQRSRAQPRHWLAPTLNRSR
jgi:hypothetical protein